MKVIALIFMLAALAAAKVSYDGDEVWRIKVSDLSAAERLKQTIKDLHLDVWAESKSSVDVRVSPQHKRPLGIALSKGQMSIKKMIPDLGLLLRKEEERLSSRNYGFSLDDYNTLEDIESYLQNVSATSDYATLRSIGKSVEGRDLWQLKISVGSGKSSLWIDCNVHAREWISGATCLYGINLLIGSYGSDADVTAFLDAYDVYFIPINNPDGYKFTWDEDRMWRKNRNKYPDTLCYGIDLNRNFDNHFGEAGSSDVPCAETYQGPSPASEPETQANQDAILELIDTADLKILISVHSYSQLWMYPFGYTDDLPPNADELDRLTEIGVNALEAVYGTQYEYGPIGVTIYPASGSSVDFAYDNGVVIGFAMELRDTGEYGFLLPADQIAPTGKETWAGIIASALAA